MHIPCIVPPYGRLERQRDRSPVAIGPIPRLVFRSHVNRRQEHPSRCEKSCRKSKWRFAFPCRAYRERVKPGCQQAWISCCFHGAYPETLATHAWRFRVTDCRRRSDGHSVSVKRRSVLDTVNAAIKTLGGKNSVAVHQKRPVSASARAKMSRAQKARWAKTRAAKKNA